MKTSEPRRISLVIIDEATTSCRPVEGAPHPATGRKHEAGSTNAPSILGTSDVMAQQWRHEQRAGSTQPTSKHKRS
jgi:hypothetical protein